jgi:hypothetical protein
MTNLKGCGRKQLWPISKYSPDISVDALRKPAKKIQDIRYPSRDSNQTLPEYNAEAFVSDPSCSI